MLRGLLFNLIKLFEKITDNEKRENFDQTDPKKKHDAGMVDKQEIHTCYIGYSRKSVSK